VFRVFLLWLGIDIARSVVFSGHVRLDYGGRLLCLSFSDFGFGKFLRCGGWSRLDANNFLGCFLFRVVDFRDIVIRLDSVFIENITIVRILVLGRFIVTEHIVLLRLFSVWILRLELHFPNLLSRLLLLGTGVFVSLSLRTCSNGTSVSNAGAGSSRRTTNVITVHITVCINHAAFRLIIFLLLRLIVLLLWGVLSHFRCMLFSHRLLIWRRGGVIALGHVLLRRVLLGCVLIRRILLGCILLG